MSSIPGELWLWIRGESSTEDFEEWLYTHGADLERALEKRTYLDLIELDFRDHCAVSQLQQRLAVQLPRACICPLLLDRQRLPLTPATRETEDRPFFSRFELLQRAPNGVRLWRCRCCGSWWLVVLDWDVSDAWYLERLLPQHANTIITLGEWPSTFRDFCATWPSGQMRWSYSSD
jgi:hypothetical protein